MQINTCIKVIRPITMGMTKMEIHFDRYESRKKTGEKILSNKAKLIAGLEKKGYPQAVAVKPEDKGDGFVYPKIYLPIFESMESKLQDFIDKVAAVNPQYNADKEAKIQDFIKGFELWIVRKGGKAQILIPFVENGKAFQSLEFNVDLSRIKSFARHPEFKKIQGMEYDKELKVEFIRIQPTGTMPVVKSSQAAKEGNKPKASI